MSDEDVREIHLSGKQLVFLFMVSVVLAVAVFLLGVSVGRGVRAEVGAADPARAELSRVVDGDVSRAMPPPTKPEARDLGYHDQLQGQAPSVAEPPSATPTPAPVAPQGVATPVDEPQGSAVGGAAVSSAATATASSNVTQPGSPAGKTGLPTGRDAWIIQAGVFKSKVNADRLEKALKAEGLPVQLVPEPGSGVFHVRVGPYATRAEANRDLVSVRRHEKTAVVMSAGRP